jgi:hypothetical protein
VQKRVLKKYMDLLNSQADEPCSGITDLFAMSTVMLILIPWGSNIHLKNGPIISTSK